MVAAVKLGITVVCLFKTERLRKKLFKVLAFSFLCPNFEKIEGAY